jgi:hypothetical protein
VFNLYLYQILKSQGFILIYLFFDCVEARHSFRVIIFEVLDIDAGSDFVSIGTLWLIRNKKFLVPNISCSAALWGLWKLRNSLC